MKCTGDLCVEWGGPFFLSLIHLDLFLKVSLPQAAAFWPVPTEG